MKNVMGILAFLIPIIVVGSPKPSMTCEPLDFKLINAPKETVNMVELNNQLNSGGMLLNMRCESKEAICFIVNNAMSCIKK